jgi:hypothetical protein
MQLYRNLLLAGLIAALLACPLEADAALQATVDRQEVLPGETITLTLRQDELASAEEPDLRTLEQYFQILDIRRSQQVNIVNGYRTESMDWIIVLLPKDAAVTMIPPIRAGAATTAPIAISQVFPSDTDQDARPELFVEAEIEETEGFVGAEILYTVRVYDKGKMQSGTLRPPDSDFVSPRRNLVLSRSRLRFSKHECDRSPSPTAAATAASSAISLIAPVKEAHFAR